jgi:hypothetical protein
MSTQDRLPSEAARQALPHDVAGVGLAFAAGGLYFIIGTAGYLPMPEITGPNFLGYCVGAAFLFTGLTCFVRARAGMADQESDLPDSAPTWLKLSYRMLAIGVAGALAIIGTWIAIGSGPRAFNLSATFLEMHTAGEVVGRVVFGLGATITWIYAIALTVGTVRKIFDRRGG